MFGRRGFVIALLVGAVLVGWGWVYFFADLPSVDRLEEVLPSPSARILDRDGDVLYEIIDPSMGKHTPLSLDQIPLALRQATVATEDAGFYLHPGIDLRGIVRALWLNLREGRVVAGGSTIPQQVVRHLLLGSEEREERTLRRKVREMVLAWQLTRKYSRDEILAIYLNTTYYGNMAYGVEAAAEAYFGKSAWELDLAECAMLAGLPQAPALYNPLLNLEAARERQAVVLDLMVKRGFITPEEAELAKEEPLHFAATPFPIRAPHFVMYVWAEVERALGTDALYEGGYVITTTLDLQLQEAVERIVRRRLELLNQPSPKNPPRNVQSAAVVVMHPVTGEILAMVGSPDYFDASIDGAVNATVALRQPGSSIKPLTYAAAFDPNWEGPGGGPFTPATVVLDERTPFITHEGDLYVPLNYKRDWHGAVTLREALACSYNVPAVKVLQAVGVDRVLDLAHRLGIASLDQGASYYDLSLTLGGGEVRLLELTAAYGAFANGGYRLQPVAVREVRDAQGRLVYRGEGGMRERALDPRVAYLITDILSDETARMPEFGVGSPLWVSRPAAVKTGTTTNWRDNWTVGYTPDLVVGVWVGNPDNTPMRDVSGVSGAGPIWHDVIETALKGMPERPFLRPEGLVDVEVCALSGLLPGPQCTHRRMETFIAGTEPKEVCPLHHGDEDASDAVAFFPTERWRWGEVALISPLPGAVYQIQAAVPREEQQIALEARVDPALDVQGVTFYVDGVAVGSAKRAPYRVWWPLQPGDHVAFAVAHLGDGPDRAGREVHFKVIEGSGPLEGIAEDAGGE